MNWIELSERKSVFRNESFSLFFLLNRMHHSIHYYSMSYATKIQHLFFRRFFMKKSSNRVEHTSRELSYDSILSMLFFVRSKLPPSSSQLTVLETHRGRRKGNQNKNLIQRQKPEKFQVEKRNILVGAWSNLYFYYFFSLQLLFLCVSVLVMIFAKLSRCLYDYSWLLKYEDDIASFSSIDVLDVSSLCRSRSVHGNCYLSCVRMY